LSLEKTKKETK